MELPAEIPFRVAVGLCWVLYTVIRVRYQAAVRNEKPITQVAMARTRLFFRIMAIAFLLFPFYFLTTWFDFAHLPLSPEIRWIAGGLLLLAFLALFTWSHVALGRNWSGLLEMHDGHMLVTSGPYRWIRHPMYASFFLSAVGFFLLSANWLVGGAYLLSVTMMVADRLAAEERMMEEAFGDMYRDYRKRTGLLLPKLSR